MKQHEAVIKVMESKGGYTTLGSLYQEVLKIKGCEWKTKTPFASIRRIVQDKKLFFKIRPGLWALLAYKEKLPPEILSAKNLPKSAQEEYNHTYYQGQFIPDAYKVYISSLERIGKFKDGENRIDILIVKLQKETSIERARTMQRNFVAGYLQGKYGSSNEKEAALVAFISPDEEDWRFSLVKMDYKFEQTKTGRIKVKEEFTPARQWTSS